MSLRSTLPLLALFLPGAVAFGQSYQRHAPYLLPAQVVALGLDPTDGRLAALMQSPVGWPTPEMFRRVGTRWQGVTDSMPTLQRLVPDVQRRRLVGLGLAGSTLTTWEWDGMGWTSRDTMLLPQTPNQLLACYHGTQGKVLLIDPLTRTVVWDGTQWTQVGAAPPWSRDGGLVYDARRDRVVFYSGSALYEFDGAAWQQRTFAVEPPARGEFALVYDPVRQRTVLFGGNTFSQLQDTWEYDGAQWLPRTPAHLPPARMRHAMEFDPVRQRVVLVGGWGFEPVAGRFGAWHNDEWEWDGQDWVAVQSDRRPPFADPVGMAEDPVGGGVLLTSSRWSPTGTNMWRWRGAEWLPHAPGSAVPADVRAMCSDPVRGAIWCFDSGLVSRTWRFDGSAWAQMSPAASPPPRGGAAIAFDRARSVVVLFGGDDYSTTFDDTWLWDGTSWTQRFPAQRPQPRFNHTMAFDAIGGRVLMSGGRSGPAQTTWAWDGTSWTDLGESVATGFGPRMVEHRARGTVVLWNGTGITAEWNGTTWTLWSAAMPGHLYAARYLSGASYGDTLVVFDRANTWVAAPAAAELDRYGTGCGGPGVPRLDAGGAPTPGTTDFELVVDRAEPAGLAFLLLALAPDNVPLGACTLLLQSPVTLGLAPVGAGGAAAFPMPLPDLAWLLGVDLRWQAVTVGGGGGVGFTAGLRTRAGY